MQILLIHQVVQNQHNTANREVFIYQSNSFSHAVPQLSVTFGLFWKVFQRQLCINLNRKPKGSWLTHLTSN